MEEDDQIRLKLIAERIKELRLKAGYKSHEKFAMDHDLQSKQYWRLETGRNFTMATLLHILRIHKMTLREFFKDLDA